jgi:hypothetical protein
VWSQRWGRLSAHDLGDALVRNSEDLSNRSHRQATSIGAADRLVAVGAQLLARALELSFALAVLAGERGELGARVR